MCQRLHRPWKSERASSTKKTGLKFNGQLWHGPPRAFQPVVPALLFSSVDPPCSLSLVVEMTAPAARSVIRKRIKEIAQVRVRYGYQRIYVLLRREGWRDNHKRVYRVYCEEGLHLRSKRPRRNRAAAHRLERPQLSSIHQCWNGPP